MNSRYCPSSEQMDSLRKKGMEIPDGHHLNICEILEMTGEINSDQERTFSLISEGREDFRFVVIEPGLDDLSGICVMEYANTLVDCAYLMLVWMINNVDITKMNNSFRRIYAMNAAED